MCMCLYTCSIALAKISLSKHTTHARSGHLKSRLQQYPVVAAGRCYVAVYVFVAFAAVLIVVAKVPTGDSIKCAFRPRQNLAVCSRAHRKRHIHVRRNLRQKIF